MLSDRGRVRKGNEDAAGASPEHGVFVVCDGMGGAAAGEVASHLALETFLHTLASSQSTPAARLHEAVLAANDAVFRHAQSSPALRGMGTTLVALLWQPVPDSPTSAVWLAHVGDSRCYRLRAGALELLTHDHSIVEEQVRAGIIRRIDAAFSPVRNIITRAIGSQPTVEPEIAAHPAQPGDLYLLASDGLTRDLNEPTIARILARAASPAALAEATALGPTTLTALLDRACHALIDAANAKGGGDNITVLLVPCP
jgi:protein phosphatase